MKILISITELDSKSGIEQIPLECLWCGKTHYRTKTHIKRILTGDLKNTNKGCYCSHKCKNEARKNSKIYNCKQCGKDVKRTPSSICNENIFCSSSCSAKFNNVLKTKPKKEYKCAFCKNIFIPKRNTYKKYCSISCQSKERSQKVYNDIDNGIVTGHANNTIRNYLLLKRGCKCETCGITEWGGKPLVVIMDHIDGNSNNWLLSNLRLICSNCDTLTSTYKKKNNGNGRHSRRERYKNNQSY